MLLSGVSMMPIFDNHLHVQRKGKCIEAIKDFKNAGGTHVMICQHPMVKKVIRNKGYSAAYKETLDIAAEIRSQVDVGVFVTVGPYPVDYLCLREKFGREKAKQIMKSGMDEAAELCAEKKCVAIGEIGRPHFSVDEEVLHDSNEILQYGMEVACEIDVPVVLHTESTTPEQCHELAKMGDAVGLPADKIVKHFSPPLITQDENYGVVPSLLARKENVVAALKKGSRFLMETDFIDDPSRPGAVLGPKTVPRTTLQLMDEDVFSEEQVYHVHKDLPEKTYGISID